MNFYNNKNVYEVSKKIATVLKLYPGDEVANESIQFNTELLHYYSVWDMNSEEDKIIITVMSLLIVLIVYFGINFKMTFSNSTYSLIFVTLCATWLFSIIYMLRNKTYYYVDKADYKYLIRKKDLNSKEEKDDSERFIADHIRYDDKDIDILNGIDLLFSLPNNKIINKRIKNKVLNYSKYQIDSIQNITNFIGIKIYKIIFKNNKSKVIITFNNL